MNFTSTSQVGGDCCWGRTSHHNSSPFFHLKTNGIFYPKNWMTLLLLFLSFTIAYDTLTAQSISCPSSGGVQVGSHTVKYAGNIADYPSTGETTFFYCVTSSSGPAISHIVFGLGASNQGCINLNMIDAGKWSEGNPPNLNSGAGQPELPPQTDPTTGLFGLKFDEEFGDNQTKLYYFTVKSTNNLVISEGDIDVAIKASGTTPSGTVTGPVCITEPDPTPDPNPDLMAQCPLDVVFVVDESGSLDNFEEEVEDGIRAWLQGLNGTGSRVAFIKFSDGAAPYSLTGPGFQVIDDNLIDAYDDDFVDDYDPDGCTNWEAAFNETFLFQNNEGVAPLVVFFTDGNPTAFVNDNGFNKRCNGSFCN